MALAPKVKLTLPLLEEINVFSQLNLAPERVGQIPCFSNPVLSVHTCNSLVAPKPDEQNCAIHWICAVNLAARYGFGLKVDEPYDYEKSKAVAKTLTYEKLVEAIQQIQTQATVDVAALQEASIAAEKAKEGIVRDAKLAEKLAEKPPVKAAKPKEAGAPASSAMIAGYSPGSMAHFILSNMEVNVPRFRDQIWALVEAKGWKNVKHFDRTVEKIASEGKIEATPTHLTRKV